MRIQLFSGLTVVILLLTPNLNFGQVVPNLGATSSFAVFTGTGATFTNSGASVVTGDIGASTATTYNFAGGILNGNSYLPGSIEAANAAADIITAYDDLTQGGTVLGVALVDGQTIHSGVYNILGAATLNGTLVFDADGDPNAIFIITINGAFSAGTTLASSISLINSASLCHVFWQVDGAFSLAAGSIFGGTVIATGTISLLEGSSIQGRALSTAGSVDLHNNAVTITLLPAIGLTVGGSVAICTGTGTNITIALSESGTSYQLRNDNANELVGSAVTGTGGLINLPTGNLTVTTTFNIYATNGCGSVELTETEVVTINPLPPTTAIYHQ